MSVIHIQLPLEKNRLLPKLSKGDRVSISGSIYTARDASHRRLVEMINRGEQLPVSLEGQGVYYMGPSPVRPGYASGSAGPTTSKRMDKYTLPLLKCGLKVMIGKGERSETTAQDIRSHKAVYIKTIGGAGAYLAQCILSMDVAEFADLGPEAIYKLTIKDLPGFVDVV